MPPKSLTFQEWEAVALVSAELYEVFVKAFGKEPNPEIVREEAESIVSKYGVHAELKGGCPIHS